MRFAIILVLVLFSGCHALSVGKSYLPSSLELPGKRTVMRDQLIVHTDFYLPKRHRLLDGLAQRRKDVVNFLQIPVSDEPIHVYLFASEEAFNDYMNRKHPLFPNRRAFFVKSDTSLMVFAWWGNRIAEDLRHEVTHGYIHSAIDDIPLWIDEGIAEYFETPRVNSGFNSSLFHLVLGKYDAGEWAPDLRRLEKLKKASSLTLMDYAESWLWVHYLLHHDLETATMLRSYLNDVRTNPANAVSLSDRLAESGHDATELLSHLEFLRTTVKP